MNNLGDVMINDLEVVYDGKDYPVSSGGGGSSSTNLYVEDHLLDPIINLLPRPTEGGSSGIDAPEEGSLHLYEERGINFYDYIPTNNILKNDITKDVIGKWPGTIKARVGTTGIYAEPKTSSERLVVIGQEKEQITILKFWKNSSNVGWYQVNFAGIIGWASISTAVIETDYFIPLSEDVKPFLDEILNTDVLVDAAKNVEETANNLLAKNNIPTHILGIPTTHLALGVGGLLVLAVVFGD